MNTKLLMVLAVAFTAMSCQKNTEQSKVSVITENLKYNEGITSYNSAILVSNFGTNELNPLNAEGKGYITRLTTKGSEILIPADGNLSAPKGMAVKGDLLFIADVSKVVVYNLAQKGASPAVISFPEGNLFVNDIVIDNNTAYVSVTNTGKIFKIDISVSDLNAAPVTEYADVPGANGLLLAGKKLYIASYPPTGVTSSENVIYQISDTDNPVVTKLIEIAGQYDGLAMHNSNLYFSNWEGGKIGSINIETQEVTMLDTNPVTLSGPADIFIQNGTLYIPDLPGSKIVKIVL